MVVTRINNLYRHLMVVHKSKKPYFCKYQGCNFKSAKPKGLRDHLALHRAERRQLRAKQTPDADGDSAKTFVCEFPDCGKVIL